MKFGDLIINISDVIDSLALQQNALVSAIFAHAEEVIMSGGRIILQREYINAPPDIIQVFSKIEEIRCWKDQLNEAQGILKKTTIG